MGNILHKTVTAGLGASTAMTGVLLLSRCSGGACTSCYGCAAVGFGVVAALIAGRVRADKEADENGMG